MQLDLKNIALVGRTYEEYYKIFELNDDLLSNEIILDAASGVSSFCAEANARGFNVTSSDRIYVSTPDRIEQKCIQDLNFIINQLPDIADLYNWTFFKDVEALRAQREKAYKLFIEDFRNYGKKRYIPVEYPATGFLYNQFNICLVSHFLFLYEECSNNDKEGQLRIHEKCR